MANPSTTTDTGPLDPPPRRSRRARRRREAPGVEVVWSVVRWCLIAVVVSNIGFATTLWVLHRQSSEKREGICNVVTKAVAQDLPRELAVSFGKDPNGPEARDLGHRLDVTLQACQGYR